MMDREDTKRIMRECWNDAEDIVGGYTEKVNAVAKLARKMFDARTWDGKMHEHICRHNKS
jgi:isopentenyl phosphate kinase